MGAVVDRSLEWVINLLTSCSEKSNGRFTIMPGHSSLSPKLMIAMDHENWGSCFVHVAQGDSAALLRNELLAIKRCHDLGLSNHVPKVLHWEDTGSLVAYAVPQFGPANPLSLEVAANLICPIHLATGTRAQIGDTPLLASLQDWHKSVQDSSADLAKVLSLGSKLNIWVMVSMIHRDFGWDNILSNGNDSVIIDWEWTQPNYPAVFDLFQYFVTTEASIQANLKRVSTLIESPEVAIPDDLAPLYVESLEREKLQVLVGLWLADYLKIRFQLAQKTGLDDPNKLEAGTWLSTWSSIVSDSQQTVAG